MSGLGASADCPAPITAGNGDSICEPSINRSPVSVINSVARSRATNYTLKDTVLGLDLSPIKLKRSSSRILFGRYIF